MQPEQASFKFQGNSIKKKNRKDYLEMGYSPEERRVMASSIRINMSKGKMLTPSQQEFFNANSELFTSDDKINYKPY